MNKQGKNRVLYYTAAVIGGLIYIALAVFMSVMVIKLCNIKHDFSLVYSLTLPLIY